MCTSPAVTLESMRPTRSVPDRQPLPSKEARDLTVLALKRLSPHACDVLTAYNSLSLNGMYRLIKVLGEGAYGLVLQAQDQEGTLVAIKIAKSVTQNQSLWREAGAIQEANEISPYLAVRYAHVDTITLGGSDTCAICCNHRAMLITSYGGDNLSDACVRRNPEFTLDQFLCIVHDCIRFAADIHAYQRVLNDVRPHNIVIDKNGQIRFIDFGEWGEEGAATDTWYIACRWYRSPDHLLKKLSTSQVLFGIGCTLAELATGIHLFPDTPSRPSSAKQCMHLHLEKVFELLGPPSWEFVQKVPDEVREQFFVIDQERHSASLQGISAEELRRRTRMFQDRLRDRMFQSVSHLNPKPRIKVGNMPPQHFVDHLFELVLLCLTYESPIDPQELLAHPLLKLTSIAEAMG